MCERNVTYEQGVLWSEDIYFYVMIFSRLSLCNKERRYDDWRVCRSSSRNNVSPVVLLQNPA